MRINLISFSDKRGGAAIAADKQYQLIKNKYDVKFIVAEKKSSELNISGPNKFSYYVHLFLRCISFLLCKLQKSNNKTKHSLNIFSSMHVANAIDHDADIIHLHWFNNETCSLRRLNTWFGRYKSRFFITLHDDWFFSGSEHYSLDPTRYINGYLSTNNNVRGLDLDKWVFNRKLRLKSSLTKNHVIFTAPSVWMVERAKSSFLLNDLTVKYLPNIIDVDIFKPKPIKVARDFLFVPMDKMVICFGAIGGTSNYLKGYDLLTDALNQLKGFKTDLNIHLLIFGGEKKLETSFLGFDVTYTGHVSDPSQLASIYSASDVVIVPSRIESFGQVAAESLACETPVVCFNNSAVAEIVDDGLSGFTVEAFNTSDLALKIAKILSLPQKKRSLFGKFGRKKILENYSSKVVLPILDEIYNTNTID
ncbi:glycosyltransferase [Moritella sp. F3]|uniref:glycosyltransferase n=1 Tax=Moritella sp. F3 TaxID=2718882 RepID=UPI0018E0DC38|nr:glycosyltransferase [Moritella sp. F3]GIC77270.1 glycosyl transferase [Moritella sp. F1]GIC83202.1 glycosyl transferase [Moritella sp. F3]